MLPCRILNSFFERERERWCWVSRFLSLLGSFDVSFFWLVGYCPCSFILHLRLNQGWHSTRTALYSLYRHVLHVLLMVFSVFCLLLDNVLDDLCGLPRFVVCPFFVHFLLRRNHFGVTRALCPIWSHRVFLLGLARYMVGPSNGLMETRFFHSALPFIPSTPPCSSFHLSSQ